MQVVVQVLRPQGHHQEDLVHQASQARPAHLVLQAHQASKDLKENRVLMGHQDSLVLVVSQVHQELVLLTHQNQSEWLQDHQEVQGNVDREDHLDHLVQVDLEDRLAEGEW